MIYFLIVVNDFNVSKFLNFKIHASEVRLNLIVETLAPEEPPTM